MTMAFAFGMFDSKAKRMKDVITARENAIEGRNAEEAEAAGRLRDTLHGISADIKRMPLVDAIVWPRRSNGGD